MNRMKRGPIVDTAAQVSVVNKWDKKYLITMRRLQQPAVIRAAVGTTTVAEAGTLQVGDIEIQKAIALSDSPDSVVAMQDMALQGYTLVQGLKAAALVKGEHMIELVPSEGGMFRKGACLGCQ